MKNCVGIAELLCAYADNELSESNRRLVEDHLIICENCSAILKIYKEISDSVNDTNVPAPDALCIGVMNRLQSEEPPQKVTMSKKRKQYHFILTRYAPIAACLVVVLLVMQFWNPFSTLLPGSSQMNDAMSPAPAPEAATFAGSLDDANDILPGDSDFGLEAGGGDNTDTLNQSLSDEPSLQRTDDDESVQRRTSNITVSNESLIPFTINEDSITPDGAVFVITNESENAIEFGEQYTLQVLYDDIWYDIVETNGHYWNDILYVIEPGETHTNKVDWSYVYGNLPEGVYRIVKAINETKPDEPVFFIAGEFTVR